MGKFDDALKKTRLAMGKPAAEPISSKVVKMPRDAVDALRLETQEPETSKPSPHPFRGRMDYRLVCVHEPSSPGAECFKLLRSKLIVGKAGEVRRAIMVTGTHPQDGKSLVSANLAVSIAQGINEYVLLVDSDMRRPSLSKYFGLNTAAGLREYLEQGSTIEPYLYKTPISKLTLLPAGSPLSSPSEFLSSEKMRLLVHELRDRYKDRFVIFDSPPAHFSADTATLVTSLDGVILVVRSGKTPREPLMDVINNIGRDKILGLVFNDANESKRDYRYYYRYYQREDT